MNIKGKVVIVTGASSGIGEATARQFGREGAKIVLAARRGDRLGSRAQEIHAMGTGAESLVVQADLSKLEDIQKLVQGTIEKFDRLDVLVNNAGFGRLDWLEKLDPIKDIQAQFDVNVMGVIQTTRQVLPVMMKQRLGHVINMGSMAGLVATPTYTVYAATKHAVHGFSEALRREVKPWGIEVSMIYPGGVVTEFASHAGSDIEKFKKFAPELRVEWAKKHPLATKAFKSQWDFMKSIKVGYYTDKDLVDPEGKKLEI